MTSYDKNVILRVDNPWENIGQSLDRCQQMTIDSQTLLIPSNSEVMHLRLKIQALIKMPKCQKWCLVRILKGFSEFFGTQKWGFAHWYLVVFTLKVQKLTRFHPRLRVVVWNFEAWNYCEKALEYSSIKNVKSLDLFRVGVFRKRKYNPVHQ